MGDASKQTLVRRIGWRVVHAVVRAFWGLKVSGLEHLPPSGPLIIACNHVSWWDGPVLIIAAGRERYIRFLTKIELFRIPILGSFLKNVGMVPVDRAKGDIAAIRMAVDLIRSGAILAIFPEGTRSKTGEMRRPKPGVGFLARESGAPLVVARAINTDKAWKFRPFEVRFGPALRFEQALAPAGAGAGGEIAQGRLDRKRCQEFAEGVMERIKFL